MTTNTVPRADIFGGSTAVTFYNLFWQILKDGACEQCPVGSFVKNNMCKYCKEGLYREAGACVGTEQSHYNMYNFNRSSEHHYVITIGAMNKK